MSSVVAQHMRGLAAGFAYVLCNYIIANIPSWHVRRALYRACGMKIGRGSRIMMKVIVTHPWKIAIGAQSVVNEFCYLDGRGGLTIGDRVNVALYSMLVTGSHDGASQSFAYFAEPIVVEDDVWIAARSMVLNGCILKQGCIIAAGAVVSPHTVCDPFDIWGGIPARRLKDRSIRDSLQIAPWHVHVR